MTPPYSMKDRTDWIAPDPSLFERRARRFDELALEVPALKGYLRLMARLAARQAELFPMVESLWGTPTDSTLNPHLVSELAAPLAEDLPGQVIKRLETLGEAELGALCEAYTLGSMAAADSALAPFVGAAFQLMWTARAVREFSFNTDSGSALSAGQCPCCGGSPVASVRMAIGGVEGVRYLGCGQCGTFWYRPRIDCAHCGDSKAFGLLEADAAAKGLRVEVCDACGTYIKALDLSKVPLAEPCADDLASLHLDLLASAEGYRRLGSNPYLMLGLSED